MRGMAGAESIVHVRWLQEYAVLLYRRRLFDDSMEPRNIFCFERKNYDGGGGNNHILR